MPKIQAPAPQTFEAITRDGALPVVLIDLTSMSETTQTKLWKWYVDYSLEDYQRVYTIVVDGLTITAYCVAGVKVAEAWQFSGIPDDVYCIVKKDFS